MPNFDGGHYFFTALIPIATEATSEEGVFTSPVHALRKELAKLPATPTIHIKDTKQSPFARNRHLHFARFVIIDDVAYNGRLGADAILSRLRSFRDPEAANPVIAQAQDHLSRPYLLLSMDFDVADGSDATRDRFLRDLWDTAGTELGQILRYAVGFDKVGASPAGVAAYLADCQIETTMPFNDYDIGPLDEAGAPKIVDWPQRPSTRPLIICGAVGAGLFVLGLLELAAALVALIFAHSWPGLALTGALLIVFGFIMLGLTVYAAARNVEQAGLVPFPTAAGTTLPHVLKGLHLQRAFTRFAIDNQVAAARAGSESDERLHKAFAAFLAAHKPSNLSEPTQSPGALGI